MADDPKAKVAKTDDEWRTQLTAEEFQVAREAGTERAFTGRYWDEKRSGVYRCVCCGVPLFSSTDKFDSGSGWPSYTAPQEGAPLEVRTDSSHGMVREEVVCGQCDAHLGHRFPDGPAPTGQRYCINSVSLTFEPE